MDDYGFLIFVAGCILIAALYAKGQWEAAKETQRISNELWRAVEELEKRLTALEGDDE